MLYDSMILNVEVQAGVSRVSGCVPGQQVCPGSAGVSRVRVHSGAVQPLTLSLRCCTCTRSLFFCSSFSSCWLSRWFSSCKASSEVDLPLRSSLDTDTYPCHSQETSYLRNLCVMEENDLKKHRYHSSHDESTRCWDHTSHCWSNKTNEVAKWILLHGFD